MGGEVEEQRFACKICGKSCRSGRSLGSHMKVHFASKEAAKSDEIKTGCKECGHSIKNKNGTHRCRECCRGFDCFRAVFGHMKSHLEKRSRDVVDGNGFSDLETLCPVRKKRSTIIYDIPTHNPSSSNLSEHHNSVDVLDAAEALMLMSIGGRDLQ